MYRFALAPLPLFAALAAACVSDLATLFSRSQKRSGLGGSTGLRLGLYALVAAAPQSHYSAYQFQQQVESPAGLGWASGSPTVRQQGLALPSWPIGAVAYYSKLEVRDMLGLTDRHMPGATCRARPGLGRARKARRSVHPPPPAHVPPARQCRCNRAAPRSPQAALYSLRQSPHLGARTRYVRHRTDFERYQPRSVQFTPGQYLNFYELKPEFRQP